MTGNHLGEEGIAEIQDLMTDMNKQDSLGSFRYDLSVWIKQFPTSDVVLPTTSSQSRSCKCSKHWLKLMEK